MADAAPPPNPLLEAPLRGVVVGVLLAMIPAPLAVVELVTLPAPPLEW